HWQVGAEYWSPIITYRGAAIPITSIRKSTPSEIDTYEKIEG
ncbi:MAG: toxin, partial [Verrucomicrobia bacterium]